MWIQTLSGDLFSIPYSEGESLDAVKKKIAAIEPEYDPFGQCLIPLSGKPLRPLRSDATLGLLQEHVAVRFLRPIVVALVAEPPTEGFPSVTSIRGFYYSFHVRYHRKRAPRTFYRKAFLYDPETDRFATPGEFIYMYHRFEPFRTFVMYRWMEDIQWHSTLREMMEWLHLHRGFPFSEAIFEVAQRSWNQRREKMSRRWKEEITAYRTDVTEESERRAQFPRLSDPPLFDYEYDT